LSQPRLEEFIKVFRRCLSRARQKVSVSIKCNANVCMSQPLTHYFRVYSGF